MTNLLNQISEQAFCLGGNIVAVIILAAMVIATSHAADVTIPTLEPLRARTAPKIDGLLDDECWQQACPIKTFLSLGDGKAHDDLAWAKVSYDDNYLYIAYHMRSDGAVIPSGSRVHDEGVWFSNQNVQVFIQPTATSGYYCFTVNAYNTQEDAKDYESMWNCRWDSAVFIAPDKSHWQVEMAFPYAVFDLSAPVDQNWRLNLTTVVSLGDKGGHVLTWAPCLNHFHSPALFGHLKLRSDQWPQRQCQLTVQAHPGQAGTLELTSEYRLVHDPRPGIIDVTMTGDDGLVTNRTQHVPLDQTTRTHAMQFPVTETGTYSFTASIREAATERIFAERQALTTTPEPFRAWPDRSVYADQQQARINIEAWRPGMVGRQCKIIVQDADGSQVGAARETEFNRASRAEVTLDLTPLPVGRYTVQVQSPDSCDIYAQCPLQKLSPQPGTVSYNDQGVLLLDHEPVLPVGIYYIQSNINDEGLLDEFVDAGFNTIVWEWTDAAGYVRALNEMKGHGLDLICSVQNEGLARNIQERYWKATGEEKEQLKQDYYERVEYVVKHVAESNPTNLLCWYIQDEPNPEILPFVRPAAEITARTDPRRPTMVVLCFSNFIKDYADVVDVIAPNPYPGFPDGPMVKVASFVDVARRATHGRQPVIAVLQAFGEPSGPNGVMPTPAELRCMSYLALVHRACGLIYFSYSYNGPMREANPAQWQELKTIAGQVRDLAPVLAQQDAAFSAKQSDGTEQVHTRLIQHDKTAYIIAVNTRRTPIAAVHWRTDGLKSDRPIEVMFENRSLNIENSRFTDDFAPLEVHVYKQTIP